MKGSKIQNDFNDFWQMREQFESANPLPRRPTCVKSKKSLAFVVYICTFSALTLLVGHQEEHPVCKNCLMRCWCGYLSAAWCRLFAYSPADATAIPKPHHLLPHINRDWFTLLLSAHPDCPGKETVKRV